MFWQTHAWEKGALPSSISTVCSQGAESCEGLQQGPERRNHTGSKAPSLKQRQEVGPSLEAETAAVREQQQLLPHVDQPKADPNRPTSHHSLGKKLL